MSANIAEVVFATAPRGRPVRFIWAAGLAAALHAALIAWALLKTPSLEDWSARVALIVHDELGREDAVSLEPEQEVAQPPARPPLPLQHAARAAARAERSAAPSQAPAPAEAAAVLTAEPSGPVDLSALTVVTGQATTAVGGAVSRDGVASPLGPSGAVRSPAGPPAPDLSSPVTLGSSDWSCAWPKTAVGELVDRQTVVIQVKVDAAGALVGAKVLRDAPGGFGDAALACARATVFTPARDRRGAPVAAESPPIVVEFSR